jgi:hypothetical protein
VWKLPRQTKGTVLRKTLQVLAGSRKSPHLEGGTHWNYTVVAGLQDDLVGQQSKSNRNNVEEGTAKVDDTFDMFNPVALVLVAEGLGRG